ncbi:uncharacterized protein LOC121823128 [Peromyscus maniculatus bairdii]|uniref:uncharacterized protein LOC121823128 n=1 Tax=Peromyscus maniculatus bairdii TaxID=230844 RepID=UPI003FD267E8
MYCYLEAPGYLKQPQDSGNSTVLSNQLSWTFEVSPRSVGTQQCLVINSPQYLKQPQIHIQSLCCLLGMFSRVSLLVYNNSELKCLKKHTDDSYRTQARISPPLNNNKK